MRGRWSWARQRSRAEEVGRWIFPFAVAWTSFACQSPTAPTQASPESPAACEARKTELIRLVERLPQRAIAGTHDVEVPASSVGGVPGNGPVLELSATTLVLDGRAVPDSQSAARLERIRSWAAALGSAESKPVLYLAVAQDVDVRTLRSYLAVIPENVDLKLLVRLVTGAPRGAAQAPGEAMAAKLLAERDERKRAEVSLEAYRSFAKCDALERAVVASAAEPSGWAARRKALMDTLPSCSCSALDTASLRPVVVAEQRAGAAGLGTLPASFLRDPRCVASMPSRSLAKLVKQIGTFDEEFAGTFEEDAVKFEQVIGNERLLNYFCNALPGETLAAQQRARATLYWRVPGSEVCQAWRFEPLSPGAPMGTWRRTSGTELAFHYWQAAEEIKLFGPALTGTKPTDEREWQCQENFRMVGVDARSIATETARWYLDEVSCRSAPPEAAAVGCVTALLSTP